MEIVQLNDSEEYRTIHLNMNGSGPLTEALIYTVTLNLHFPNSKSEFMEVFLLYEPITGSFWWRFRRCELPVSAIDTGKKIDWFLEGERFVFLNARIVLIKLYSCTLWIRDCLAQYATFEEARTHFFLTLEKKLESSNFFSTSENREINLGHYLNEEFFRIRGDLTLSGRILPAKITDIKYHHSQWQIELEGNDNRKIPFYGVKLDKLASVPRIKATVFLNDNYEVIEVIAEDFVKQIDGMMK